MDTGSAFKRGFTLIELLVVLSIIALLSSITISAINSARIKSRDAKRSADIAQIRKAFELYYDATGTYPSSGGAASPNNQWTTSNDSSWGTVETVLRQANIISALPHDPRETASCGTNCWAGNANNFTYSFYSDPIGGYCPGRPRQWYVIVYRREGAIIPSIGMADPCPPSTGSWNYGAGGAPTSGNSAI